VPHADIDQHHLCELLEGFSGAEIVGIFRDAGIRAVHEDTEIPTLTSANIEAAIASMPKQITPTMLEFYAKFTT
jgi:AAA family ATPase